MAAKQMDKRAARLNSARPMHDGTGWMPRIIVRFRDDVDVPYDVTDLGRQIDRRGIGPWGEVLRVYPHVTIRSLFTSVTPKRLEELVALALERDKTYTPANFLSYCVVESPVDFAATDVVLRLRTWTTVRSAYIDSPSSEAAVMPGDDELSPHQGYLDPAPDGIDAEFAWTLQNGDGTGQQFIHLERGWTLDHEDLKDHNIALLYGAIRDQSRPHGTAALGEVCAVDNAVGCVGIAPKAGPIKVVSYHGAGKTRADAMMAAIDDLPFGGVLLAAAQLDELTIGPTTWYAMPIELLEAEFDVIRLATALGITVIEPAGNGGNDLDTFVDNKGNQVLNRASGGFADSGAIMVAAASATAPHTPAVFSPPSGPPFIFTNFGSRADCYAWGEQVVSTASTGSAPFATDSYTTTFAGTSAAAPIIAGAALVVQGLADFSLGYRLSASQMRRVLTDPANSTPSNDPVNDRIGVMPDLQAISSASSVNVAPDVYVRDFVGDDGDPHNDIISVSPDVIVRPNLEANPDAAFGEGSGTENSVLLGSSATAGQDNYVYVRVKNRGGADAANVTASVYWSRPATLITPDLWTAIGHTVIANVPAGNVLAVSPAIVWPSAAIPATGHYCFVALVGNADDPSPAPADFLDWLRYERFVREVNNVTWHNFNVVSNQPAQGADPAGFVDLDFMAPGAPDRARFMKLEIMSRLPPDSRVLVEMPLFMYRRIRERHTLGVPSGRNVLIPVNPHGRQSLGEILFPAGSRIRLRLLVHIPEKRRNWAYELSVRQLFKDRPVGRLTWRLTPPKHPRDR